MSTGGKRPWQWQQQFLQFVMGCQSSAWASECSNIKILLTVIKVTKLQSLIEQQILELLVRHYNLCERP